MAHRLNTDPGPQFDECVQIAQQQVHRAIDLWLKDAPDKPDVSQIVEAVLHEFERRRFLRRPF